MNIKDWLYYHRLALTMNLESVEEFDQWIDKIITDNASPDESVIEIAYMSTKGKSTIIDAIHEETRDDEYHGKLDKCSIKNLLLSRINYVYINRYHTLGDCVKILYTMSLYFQEDEDYSTMNTLDDYYELAQQGIWKSIDEIKATFEALLSKAKSKKEQQSN